MKSELAEPEPEMLLKKKVKIKEMTVPECWKGTVQKTVLIQKTVGQIMGHLSDHSQPAGHKPEEQPFFSQASGTVVQLPSNPHYSITDLQRFSPKHSG